MKQHQDTLGHYNKLYALQDTVLNDIFNQQNSFYLTGGTALSRFYYQHRYSDDLDFFCHQNNDFSFDIKDFLAAVKLNNSLQLVEDVSTRDFHRYYIKSPEVSLQVDFVNDLVYREERPITLENGIRVDTINEILSNKLCAVVDRDEPKDIADIIEIFNHPKDFSIQTVLRLASEKSAMDISLLLERLRTFPVSLIDDVNYFDDKKLSPETAKRSLSLISEKLLNEYSIKLIAEQSTDGKTLKDALKSLEDEEPTSSLKV